MRIQVREKYFFKFKLEFGKMISSFEFAALLSSVSRVSISFAYFEFLTRFSLFPAPARGAATAALLAIYQQILKISAGNFPATALFFIIASDDSPVLDFCATDIDSR